MTPAEFMKERRRWILLASPQKELDQVLAASPDFSKCQEALLKLTDDNNLMRELFEPSLKAMVSSQVQRHIREEIENFLTSDADLGLDDYEAGLRSIFASTKGLPGLTVLGEKRKVNFAYGELEVKEVPVDNLVDQVTLSLASAVKHDLRADGLIDAIPNESFVIKAEKKPGHNRKLAKELYAPWQRCRLSLTSRLTSGAISSADDVLSVVKAEE
eukprot:6358798-Lingulodinium_polyedra.AAC.1